MLIVDRGACDYPEGASVYTQSAQDERLRADVEEGSHGYSIFARKDLVLNTHSRPIFHPPDLPSMRLTSASKSWIRLRIQSISP